MSQANIKFGVMLHGAGGHMNSWKHPSGPADASVNLEFYIDTALKALPGISRVTWHRSDDWIVGHEDRGAAEPLSA